MNPPFNDGPSYSWNSKNEKPPGWQMLAPIPDAVGFGGMFAGAMGGRLVAGGESQFREKPLWQQGTKTFSDRIHVLSRPDDHWRESATRLPFGWAHFAVGLAPDVVFLVGGATSSGFTRAVVAIRTRGEEVVVEAMPELPVPRAYSAAVVVGRRLFVCGGQSDPADKRLSREVWSLDVGDPAATWHREPDFPGRPAFVATAAATSTAWLVFGGLSFGDDGSLIPLAEAHGFDLNRGTWVRLPDLPEPRVGAVSPSPTWPTGETWLVGGYAEVFTGPAREHPGFSRGTFLYDAERQQWRDGPVIPSTPVSNRDSPTDAGPQPMVAAPAARWGDLTVFVGGETRSSVRTPAVLAWVAS